MRLHLVVGPDRRDVIVDAPDGTTAAELGRALFPEAPDDSPLFADGSPVAPEALVGSPPLLDGTQLTTTPDPGGRRDSPWEVRVRSGPAVGMRWRLARGAQTIGRSTSTDLRLEDPQASRVHARLTVDADLVAVDDLGTPNGTSLDDCPVGPGGAPWAPGQVLRVGDSDLEVRRAAASPSHPARSDGVGHLLVHRPPRAGTPHPTTVVEFPTDPPPPPKTRAPVLAVLLPLAVSAALAVVMGSPLMMLFGLTGPLLLLGTWLSERRRRTRRRPRAKGTERDAALAAAHARLAAALDAEARSSRAEHPGPAELLAWAQDRRPRLWERTATDADALTVRVGLGTVPARATTATNAPEDTATDLPCAPVLLDLREHRVVGVAGPRQAAHAFAEHVVGRLATALSPDDLRITVAVADPSRAIDWTWVLALPHAHGAAGHDGFVLAPREPDPRAHQAAREHLHHLLRAEPGAHHVLVLDGATTLLTDPLVARLVEAGPVLVVAVDSSRERLPQASTAVVRLLGTDPAALETATGTTRFTPDLPCPSWAEALSVALEPLRADSAPRHVPVIPSQVRLLDLTGPVDAESVELRWAAAPSTPYPLLGHATAGPLRVDLATEGPHALVAGTTGAGKSELLQTLVCALAMDHPPDELTLLLVDYKGGAALHRCSDLPHCVGLVTDLDDHLASRVLISLTAEVRRRERLLALAGAADLAQYQRVRPSLGVEAVPRLVVVVDEFRVLAEELPGFVQGVVRLAAVGRSLGLHLVLATQRPAGVVTADIRANVGLRIALRVRDRADSVDVLDAPDAATLDAATPGRAMLRGAATALTAFQVARVTVGPSRPPGLTVTPVGPPWLPRPGPPDPVATPGPTDLDQVVAATRAATARRGSTQPRRPWLEPLPAVLPFCALQDADGFAPVALADDPASQEQRPWSWDGLGHLGIAGAPGSGRTAALLTVARAVTTRGSPDSVHVYGVGSGDLRALMSLPHTAFLADTARPGDVALLVSRLEQVAARREVTGLRAVVLLDGWEALAAADHDSATRLLALARAGGTSPLRFVVGGERAVLAGQVAPVCSTRLLLRLSSPVDATLALVPMQALPRDPPPGRAVVVGSNLEIQLADPRTAPPPLSGSAGQPRPVLRLPDALAWHDVGTPPGHAVPELVVGVRAGDLVPAGFSPGRGQRRIVVLGPPGSGRTTTLVALGAGLVRHSQPLGVLGTRLGELLDVTPLTEVAELVRLRTTHPDLAVLVDDGERLAGGPWEPVLREVVRCVDEDGGFVAMAAASTWLARGFGSYGAELAASRTGLLLWPAPAEATPLGLARLPPELGDERPPGRGVLVSAGRGVAVQVAAP